MRRVYHLPIAYWRLLHELLAEEQDRRPDWTSTMTGLANSAAKHRRKDLELAEADCVIVASSFTRRSLSRCPELPGPDRGRALRSAARGCSRPCPGE